ncbi:MAG: hypothetical protein PHE50_02040, partial [Dehalococcoidales bacterium]|nr:hypothetical protein [Dehalococcoidales bacterium]
EDPQGDYFPVPQGTIQGDGRFDNSNPYPLPWTEFRSVTFGADDNYIYFNFQFWGEFPKKGILYNDDLLWSTLAKVEQFTFHNQYGKEDSATLAGIVSFVTEYGDGERIAAAKPDIGLNTMLSPQAMDATGETIYKTLTGAGMVAGGAGNDYVLCAFPLSLFGIHPGDEVNFSFSTETGSSKFHHEAIDFILGHEGVKLGEKITYVLGGNTYTSEIVSEMGTQPKTNTSK